MKRNLLLARLLPIQILCLAFVSTVWAAPNIVNVSGQANINQTIVLSGSNFGTKSTAAPLVYNDFESDQLGVAPAGWINKSGNPVVTDTRVYSGNKAFLSSNTGVGSSNQLIRDLGAGSISDKMYLSANIYIEKNDTNLGYQWKVWRWSGYPNVYYANNSPDIKTDNSGVAINAFWYGKVGYYSAPTQLGWYNSGSFVYSASGVKQTNYGPANRNMYGDQNKWFRFEQVITLSSAPGVADGRIDSYTNGVLTTSWTGLTTQSPGDVKWRYFMLANELESTKDANDLPTTTANMKFYWDNVYIDNTFSRVEIGNNPSYGSCTVKEIQIPVQWANDGISFKLNPGKFNSGDTAYIYVVDSNGAINETGYPIVIGKVSEGISAPKNVTVTSPVK